MRATASKSGKPYSPTPAAFSKPPSRKAELTFAEATSVNGKLAEAKALKADIESEEAGDAVRKAFGQNEGDGTGERGYLDLSAAGIRRLATRFAQKI